MRRRFKIAILAIPVGTLITHAAVGAWQSGNVSNLRDDVRIVVNDGLRLESEIGYGGLIHNFKNAILRPEEPEYISDAAGNAQRALELIDSLEEIARKEGVGVSLPETRQMVLAYQSRLSEVEAAHASGRPIAAVDNLVRFDDTLAIAEITEFQSMLVEDIRNSIEFIEMSLLLTGFLISMVALAGGFFIFTLWQSEQRRIDMREKASAQRLLEKERQHNADLKRVNTSLQQFAGLAAHDLKTPARQILSFAELARDTEALPKERESYLESIRVSASRMRVLVDTLLDFARKGFADPQKSLVDVQQLVRALTDVREQGGPDRTRIEISDLPPAHADQKLLERVFDNLIQNALKFVPEDTVPEIRIEGWKENGRSFYSVTDNGIGVDPAHSELIFMPFKRGRNNELPGNGIGLSLAKSIIEGHGGRIRLDPDYKHGARFVFWLPAAESPNLTIAS